MDKKGDKGFKMVSAARTPPPPEECPGRPYTVRTGDTLLGIARRFQVPMNDILAANPQVWDPNLIFAGQIICVPRLFPPSLRPCRVLLRGTSSAPNSIGVANIRLEPARVSVAGINLPEPRSFGFRFNTYTAWVVDIQIQSRFRINMSRLFDDVWVGRFAKKFRRDICDARTSSRFNVTHWS